MSEAKNQQMHEVERGEILRFLAELYPEGASFRSVLHALDLSAYSVDGTELMFHLNYLVEKGYVTLEEFPHRVGEKHQVRLVKITAKGIDRLDQRRAGDDGVRI